MLSVRLSSLPLATTCTMPHSRALCGSPSRSPHCSTRARPLLAAQAALPTPAAATPTSHNLMPPSHIPHTDSAITRGQAATSTERQPAKRTLEECISIHTQALSILIIAFTKHARPSAPQHATRGRALQTIQLYRQRPMNHHRTGIGVLESGRGPCVSVSPSRSPAPPPGSARAVVPPARHALPGWRLPLSLGVPQTHGRKKTNSGGQAVARHARGTAVARTHCAYAVPHLCDPSPR